MARPFDATLKELLDAFAQDWVGWIAPRLGLPASVVVEPVDADLSTIAAEADKIFRLCPPHVGFLHLEPQTGWDATLADRILFYNVLIEHRYGGPVYSVILLLRPKANVADLSGNLVRRFPSGESYLEFRYQVIRMWELPVDVLLHGGLGMLPLALLTDDSAPQLPAVISKMAERISSEVIPEGIARTLWTASYLLMGLRYDREIIDKLFQGVRDMEESTTYQAILEKGEAKGLAIGEAKGL
ncbi:MAG: hypothetical protein L0Z53_07955, partial [Acidobacteriales bacterium]|nr:hypothetical protein [Terriglobales bacterium]